MRGIIIENIANLYKVAIETKPNIESLEHKSNENKMCQKGPSPVALMEPKEQIYEATARGRFKKEEIKPVVGDFVEVEITEEEKKKAVINEILERRVYVKRPKLANITQIVFVVSSQNPKPDL